MEGQERHAGSITGEPVSSSGNSVTVRLDNDDIAFVLGKRGNTKHKLARVAGANLDVDEKRFTLTITGSELQRQRAKEYVDMILIQRRGQTVPIDVNSDREDMTVVYVPSDCVGYVTGANGKVLRGLEMEWNTLMFFPSASRNDVTAGQNDTEPLLIFGQRRGRLGAALKIMSAVEHKRREGYYVKDNNLVVDLSKYLDPTPDGFYLDQMTLKEEEFSYALGREGKTRRKLARASGCILEYVGSVAVMVGEKAERIRVREYLDWLLVQRTGNCDVNIEGRDDVDFVNVESRYVGWVTGAQGKNFRHIEESTGVYLFTNKSAQLARTADNEPVEQVLIFSYDARSRQKAVKMIMNSIQEKKDEDAGISRRRRGRSPPRRSRRDRSRSPPRRRERRHRSESPDRRRRSRRDSRDGGRDRSRERR